MSKYKRKINKNVLARILKMLYGYYPVLLPLTGLCIIISAITAAIPSVFTQKVISIIEDWYVSRNWESASKEIIPLLIILVTLYVISIFAITLYTQLMAYITQGFLCKLRRAMFDGMQNLPIRYFDTNKHGDIMSYYTNDTDAMRELVSQALPALLNSVVIVVSVLAIMIYYSIWMTLVLLLGVVAMIFVSGRIGGGSAKYFIRQQKSMGRAEGFIQEMMNGQKVIKVFCHEEESNADFDKINEALYEDSYRAHAYANTLGPIIMNIGNILYVIIAMSGGLFLLSGLPNLSISGLAFDISVLVPFLNMTKQFTGNINQVSQQINSIVMGVAGAERVFALMENRRPTTVMLLWSTPRLAKTAMLRRFPNAQENGLGSIPTGTEA